MGRLISRIRKLLTGNLEQRLQSEFDECRQKLEHEAALTAYCSASNRQLLEPLNRDGAPIRVGLTMNLANNFFHLANGLRAAGVEADLILYRSAFDNSLLGDPRWEIEEVEVTDLDQLDLGVLSSPIPPHVREIEAEPDNPQYEPHPSGKVLLSSWKNAEKFIACLQQYDILIVSGPSVAFAPFTGKPYITFPFGGDLMVYPFGDDHFARLQAAGWRRANGHIFSGGFETKYADILGLGNYTHIPHYIDTELYRPTEDEKFRRQLLKEHDCDKLFFMPSRHHWPIKCQDRVLQAIANLKDRGRTGFKVLLTTWGDDFGRSCALIKELGIDDYCAFVPTMSKPVLRKYFAAADLVLDQFALGEYGTLTLEAMAMARPVMLHYKFDDAPPILNAATSEQIAEGLEFALDNPQKMVELGKRAREWVVKTHGPDVINKYVAALEATLEGDILPACPPFMTLNDRIHTPIPSEK